MNKRPKNDMKTTVNNNSNNSNKFAIIYPGEVYVSKGIGPDTPSVMPKGKRCGYATDGEYMTAVNELHGWTLDHTIFFDWAHALLWWPAWCPNGLLHDDDNQDNEED